MVTGILKTIGSGWSERQWTNEGRDIPAGSVTRPLLEGIIH